MSGDSATKVIFKEHRGSALVAREKTVLPLFCQPFRRHGHSQNRNQQQQELLQEVDSTYKEGFHALVRTPHLNDTERKQQNSQKNQQETNF